MAAVVSHILITGDFVLDHHVYEGRRHHYGDDASVGVRVVRQAGGAALVHALLAELLTSDPAWRSQLAVSDPAPLDPSTGQRTTAFEVRPSQQAYAFWRPHPQRDGERRFWRVSEAMGFGQKEDNTPACETWPPARDLPQDPEIVVFSEGGMGFRGDESCWRLPCLDTARWIVLKTAAPLCTGKLWELLSKTHREKLVVVVSARELRQSAARVPAGLSWEQTLQHLLRELQSGRTLAPLTQCRHLVVAFESEGGLWLDLEKREGGSTAPAPDCQAHFVYTSGSIEGELAHEVAGTAFGFVSCLAATVAFELSTDVDCPDLVRAIEHGMAAMRDLRERGHGGITDTLDGFPAARVANVVRNATHGSARAVFAFGEPASRENWSLLRESLPAPGPAYEVARLVVRRGPIALANLPHLRIGKLLSADPHEIEALRSLTQVVRRYRDDRGAKRPLSIGVFGPPGAGKSFAVRELATALVGKGSWLEFNLSQFDGPEDLIGAFHQIRDRVLQQQLPVAFFDEFDSHGYEWLQHLLAPMQDGRFQEGQLTHTIGKCLFVCAGGTSWTFDTFGPTRTDGRNETQAQRDFRLLKGFDFKSRLDAYLDVVGPCRRLVSPPPEGVPAEQTACINDHCFWPDPDDIFFPVRRALMIRSELKVAPDERLEIDDGLLEALLRVEKLEHGSRSLSKLLQPFLSTDETALREPLRRSMLLPTHQLAMHTDANEFLRLCDEGRTRSPGADTLAPAAIEVMAPAIHETWRQLGRRQGWLQAEEDRDFEDIGDFRQSSNVAAASRMHMILQLVGLSLEDGPATRDEEASIRNILESHLELLADAEHSGWMEWHLARGWRYTEGLEKKDDARKLHPCLLPFSQLSESEKDKDRETIRHYPDFAREAKKKIVRGNADR